jgi:hypothetical protein
VAKLAPSLRVAAVHRRARNQPRSNLFGHIAIAGTALHANVSDREIEEDQMIKFELLKDAGVLIVEPRDALTAEDFRMVSRTVDPYIAENGKLTGLLIDAPSFPGWENFGALVEHMKFVRGHHRKIDRVAAVTDSKILAIAPKIAEHFAHPEFKVFGSGERASALGWLQGE